MVNISNNSLFSGINIPIPGKTLKRQNGLQNLLTNNSSKNKSTKVMFSNGSRPGNNINNSLPKSNISSTSDKTFGASVVPPATVQNTYSKKNYNRNKNYSSWKFWGGKSRKTRRSRK